jgi:hypothetical protein
MSKVFGDHSHGYRDGSKHAGSELLVLLAIADSANDNGYAFPSVASLAKKCRLGERYINKILATLRDSGELEIRLNGGPRGANLYRVMVGGRVNHGAPLNQGSPVNRGSALNHSSPVKRGSGGGEQGFLEGVNHRAPEPSLNHQEPPTLSPSATSRLPPCPHREILALFIERLPELPRPRPETWEASASEKDLSNRWKWVLSAVREDGRRYATTRAEALEWFGRFFDTVAASDFLTGRNSGWGSCNLQWLVKKANFTKVVEGNYRNKGDSA